MILSRVSRDGLAGEADLVADQVAERDLQLLGDPLGHRAGGDPTGLGVRDRAPAELQADLGDLGGLARPGLPRDDHDLVVADGLSDLVVPGVIGSAGSKVIVQRRALHHLRRDHRAIVSQRREPAQCGGCSAECGAPRWCSRSWAARSSSVQQLSRPCLCRSHQTGRGGASPGLGHRVGGQPGGGGQRLHRGAGGGVDGDQQLQPGRVGEGRQPVDQVARDRRRRVVDAPRGPPRPAGPSHLLDCTHHRATPAANRCPARHLFAYADRRTHCRPET